MSTVVLFSGGMDSTVLLYAMKRAKDGRGDEVVALSFNYGQRHKKELICARLIADALGVEHVVASLDARLFKGSALTDVSTSHKIPQGKKWDDPEQTATIVPNRNAVMLTQAYALAYSRGIRHVAWAAHAGDAAVYPDCREEFAIRFEIMQESALGIKIRLERPFIDIDKAGIVQLGLALEVPFGLTWTCYVGGTTACGQCGACLERLQAFKINHREDPIKYNSRPTKARMPNYRTLGGNA